MMAITTKGLPALILLLTFASAASALEFVIPPQLKSRLTHYPIWRTPVEGWDPQQLDTVTSFSVIGVLIGFGLVLRYEFFSERPHGRTISDTYRNNSRLLSITISYYLIATAAAVIGFWILDLGKLWSTVGALHNLLEVALLLVMTFSSRPNGFTYFYTLLFVYFIVTEWLCLILPWPYDGVFFKFQGLASDIGLIFNFYRLYVANRDHPLTEGEIAHDQSRVSEVEVEDENTPLLNGKGQSYDSNHSSSRLSISRIFKGEPSSQRGDHHAENGVSTSAGPSEGRDRKKLPQTTSDLIILIVAAVIHVLGNVIATLSYEFLPFLIFQFSYGIAFPLYGYYVAREPENLRLRFYEVKPLTELLVGIGSIVLSALTVGIGSFFLILKYQPGSF